MSRLPCPITSCLAFVLVLLVGVPAGARAPSPMTLVDVINVARVTDPQLSPDGRQVLFVRSDADWKANRRVSHIWRTAVDGTGLVQLTNGPEGDSAPRWSPDGRSIAFVSRRAGDEAAQIYLLSSSGGEARRLTRHDTGVSGLAWVPDGSALTFLAADPITADEKARRNAKDDVFAYEENFTHNHLWKVSAEGDAAQRLTSGAFSVGSYRTSRDGRTIVHHRLPTPLFGDEDRGEVWIMNADGTGARALTSNTVAESGAELSPDGTTVLFVSSANALLEGYYNGKLFVMPASGGTPRLLMPGVELDVLRATWSKDGRSVYFVANTGVRSELFTAPVATGAPSPLTRGDHALLGWDYEPAVDEHVFALDEPTNPGDLHLLKPGGTPARITRIFEGLTREFALPAVERVEWKGADGVTVEGLLYYPLEYARGQRYPLVVQTHGGPMSSDKFGFDSPDHYAQVLAALGYAVLKPNYRGSTGYGDAFMRDMVGQYFRNAHLDVMAGVDHVVAMGVADPDRLVKMGWSAGGHMTNKIITFTGRFKAASSGAGASNWTSMYAQSDVRSYRTPWFGGTPWQKDAPIDVYWDNSPLKDVAKAKTPTIFLVGEKDPRVPPPQSVEMYRGLKANGVPTRLYIAPREPHTWAELRHVLFKGNVELEWFERWVRQRARTWEKAPGDAAASSPDGTSEP